MLRYRIHLPIYNGFVKAAIGVPRCATLLVSFVQKAVKGWRVRAWNDSQGAGVSEQLVVEVEGEPAARGIIIDGMVRVPAGVANLHAGNLSISFQKSAGDVMIRYLLAKTSPADMLYHPWYFLSQRDKKHPASF